MGNYCVIFDDRIEGGCPGHYSGDPCDPPVFHFLKDETILEEGSPVEGVFCIHAGSVAVTRRDAFDRCYHTFRLGPGDLLGLPAALTDSVHTNGAVALEPVSACFLSMERFRNLLSTSPTITMHALRQLARRIDDSEQETGSDS